MKRECGCPVEAGPFADLFGPLLIPCEEHRKAKRLYLACFEAMAGNVYSAARLAEEGLVPGVRPDLGDFNRAAVRLYRDLSPAQRETVLREALAALAEI